MESAPDAAAANAGTVVVKLRTVTSASKRRTVSKIGPLDGPAGRVRCAGGLNAGIAPFGRMTRRQGSEAEQLGLDFRPGGVGGDFGQRRACRARVTRRRALAMGPSESRAAVADVPARIEGEFCAEHGATEIQMTSTPSADATRSMLPLLEQSRCRARPSDGGDLAGRGGATDHLHANSTAASLTDGCAKRQRSTMVTSVPNAPAAA